MYRKTIAGAGLIGGALPVTGVNVLFSLLVGAGFAVPRCVPKRHTP
jgi:hypothetical protein